MINPLAVKPKSWFKILFWNNFTLPKIKNPYQTYGKKKNSVTFHWLGGRIMNFPDFSRPWKNAFPWLQLYNRMTLIVMYSRHTRIFRRLQFWDSYNPSDYILQVKILKNEPHTKHLWLVSELHWVACFLIRLAPQLKMYLDRSFNSNIPVCRCLKHNGNLQQFTTTIILHEGSPSITLLAARNLLPTVDCSHTLSFSMAMLLGGRQVDCWLDIKTYMYLP